MEVCFLVTVLAQAGLDVACGNIRRLSLVLL